jgi:hypothetical protein
MARMNEAMLASVSASALEAELARRAGGGRRAPKPVLEAERNRRGPPIDIASNEDLEAHTIESFCRAFQISRSALYDAWAKGVGPRFFRLGAARRISVQAGRDWVRQLEQATAQTPIDDEATAGAATVAAE